MLCHGSELCLESILAGWKCDFQGCSLCLPQSCGNSMGCMEAVTLGSHMYSLPDVQKPRKFLMPLIEDARETGKLWDCTGFYIS